MDRYTQNDVKTPVSASILPRLHNNWTVEKETGCVSVYPFGFKVTAA